MGANCNEPAREKYNISMLKIRNFHVGDFEFLYRMDHICFEPGIAFSRGELALYLNHRHAIARIAELSGAIAGFILVRIERRSIAHMITLDVLPQYRRMGIGTALMEDAHGELARRRIATAILEVAVENVGAQLLYKNLGYREGALLTGYYRGREDAYRMEAKIPCEAQTPG